MGIQPLEASLTGAGKLKNATTVTTIYLFSKIFHTLILLQDDTSSIRNRMIGKQFPARLGPAFIKIPQDACFSWCTGQDAGRTEPS